MVLGILTIIASWLFHLPLEWAITLTIFSTFAIVGSSIRIGTAISEN